MLDTSTQPLKLNELDPMHQLYSSEALKRSRVPEIMVSAEILLIVSVFISTLLAFIYPGSSSWTIATPIIFGVSLGAILFMLTLIAPLPYLTQLGRLRSLQTGGNPSAVELIPIIITNLLKTFALICTLALVCGISRYLSSLDDYPSTQMVYIPAFILQAFGYLHCLLIVDHAITIFVVTICFTCFSILILAFVSESSSISLWTACTPLYVLGLYLSICLLYDAFNDSDSWKFRYKLKWMFYFVSVTGLTLTAFLVCGISDGIQISRFGVYLPLLLSESIGIVGYLIHAYIYLENPRLSLNSVQSLTLVKAGHQLV